MKDPAFLFYPQDFLVGTMTMTFEDRGKYITILSVMHQQGKLNEETIRFLIGSFSDMLRLKFKQDENGLFFNERLFSEIEKRNNFIESRTNNGKLGGRPKKENNLNITYIKPTYKPKNNLPENENINENINVFNSSLGGVGENFWGEKIDFEKLKNTQWFESILRFLKFRITNEELQEYFSQFETAMIADNNLFRAPEEYRSHFRNWVKVQVDKQTPVNGAKKELMKVTGILKD